MKKISTVSAILMATLLTTATAFAWPGGQMMGGQRGAGVGCQSAGPDSAMQLERMENRVERLAVILDLSEAQQTKLEELQKKHFEQRDALRTEMQKSRDAMLGYRLNDKFDEKEFRALAQKKADLQVEMMVQGPKHRAEMLAVLTPDQQAKAEKLQDMGFGPAFCNPGERGFGHHGKRGNGPGFGPNDDDRFQRRGNCDGNGPGRGQGDGPGKGYRYSNN
ncbi:MAG: hypothetical protein C0622_10255 [Desulfuromonas sp.]|nr:MAG: hypothetical protein C0622_10255 [Desulfuromonas sp.]